MSISRIHESTKSEKQSLLTLSIDWQSSEHPLHFIRRKKWQQQISEILFFTKGQLISKCLFGVIAWTKKPTKFFPGFLP
jgi:hypothetical protein